MAQEREVFSISNKLYDILCVPESFTPEGQSTPINYWSLVLQVKINGNEEELRAKVKGDTVKLLRAAEDLPESLLEDEEKSDKK